MGPENGPAAGAVDLREAIHEIRNVLQPIQSHIEVLSMLKTENPSYNSSLAVLRERVGQLNRTLNTLDAISQPLSLNLAPVNLPNLVNSIWSTVSDVEGGCRAGFKVHCSPPEIFATVDQYWFHQALFQLLLNSIEATRGVAQPSISAEISSTSRTITIEVRDNGVGLSPEMQSKLFHPFVSTKRDAGHGLGLVLSRRIVQLHNGELQISSKDGETIVLVMLPVRI